MKNYYLLVKNEKIKIYLKKNKLKNLFLSKKY